MVRSPPSRPWSFSTSRFQPSQEQLILNESELNASTRRFAGSTRVREPVELAFAENPDGGDNYDTGSPVQMDSVAPANGKNAPGAHGRRPPRPRLQQSNGPAESARNPAPSNIPVKRNIAGDDSWRRSRSLQILKAPRRSGDSSVRASTGRGGDGASGRTQQPALYNGFDPSADALERDNREKAELNAFFDLHSEAVGAEEQYDAPTAIPSATISQVENMPDHDDIEEARVSRESSVEVLMSENEQGWNEGAYEGEDGDGDGDGEGEYEEMTEVHPYGVMQQEQEDESPLEEQPETHYQRQARTSTSNQRYEDDGDQNDDNEEDDQDGNGEVDYGHADHGVEEEIYYDDNEQVEEEEVHYERSNARLVENSARTSNRRSVSQQQAAERIETERESVQAESTSTRQRLAGSNRQSNEVGEERVETDRRVSNLRTSSASNRPTASPGESSSRRSSQQQRVSNGSQSILSATSSRRASGEGPSGPMPLSELTRLITVSAKHQAGNMAHTALQESLLEVSHKLEVEKMRLTKARNELADGEAALAKARASYDECVQFTKLVKAHMCALDHCLRRGTAGKEWAEDEEEEPLSPTTAAAAEKLGSIPTSFPKAMVAPLQDLIFHAAPALVTLTAGAELTVLPVQEAERRRRAKQSEVDAIEALVGQFEKECRQLQYEARLCLSQLDALGRGEGDGRRPSWNSGR